MVLGRPPGHVGPNLGEQAERGIRTDGLDLREVDACDLVQWLAEFNAGGVVAALRLRARRWGGSGGRRCRGDERGEVGGDGGVTGDELLLIDVEQREVLRQFGIELELEVQIL